MEQSDYYLERLPQKYDPGGYAGRLEVYYHGVWGTVCDDFFHTIDADVVCRQLGYTSAVRYGNVGMLSYTQGEGRIWLDDVECDLEDTFLANCSHSGIGIENCDHGEDVAVSCSHGNRINEGDLRFVNETHQFTLLGRLEIYIGGQWGTICSAGFGAEDAKLACSQLGFRTYFRYGSVEELGFPQASVSTPILVSDLSCDSSNSNHLTIYHCPRTMGTSCTHNQDVALICLFPFETSISTVRLVSRDEESPRNLTAGRVVIFYAGRWGTVCSDGFTILDAMGLCHYLTGSNVVLAYGAVGSDNLEFDQGSTSTPVWVQNMHCLYPTINGRYYCDHDGLGITNCTHSRDLALSCGDGALRLISRSPLGVSDPGGSAGRLEIFYNGMWGTVCDDGFNQTAANVVCLQLGYENATKYGNVESLRYSRGNGTIWLTNVRCTSSDIFLANCSHSGFSKITSCSHNEDVAIVCAHKSTSLPLSGGLIAGIIIGVIAAIILCITAVLITTCLCRRSRKLRPKVVTVPPLAATASPARYILNTPYTPSPSSQGGDVPTAPPSTQCTYRYPEDPQPQPAPCPYPQYALYQPPPVPPAPYPAHNVEPQQLYPDVGDASQFYTVRQHNY